MSAKLLKARLLFPPSLAWNLVLGRVLGVRNWWDAIDEHVLLGALPFPRDVAVLAELGVQAVVNTCEEYAGPRRAYARHRIEQLRVPVIDYAPPTRAQITEAIAFIERHVQAGRKVYLHCKAGQGRSATIALCWIMHTQDVGPEEAFRRLQAKRPQVNPHIVHRAAVQRFAQARLPSAKGC